jgi:6-phospho-beta-glucosidase
MALKLAVIGGGSTYTPELVDGFVRRADRVPVDEIALLDIDPDRLAIVGGLAERMLARQGWTGRVLQTTSRDAAIDGADFVLIQLRVGGQGARLGDETLPARFGLIGQETVGVGGFAKALRTVPVVLELAEAVARRSAPDAWIVDFTNPVGIVTQALADAGHRSVGLCNVAIGFQRRFAARFGVEPERVELEQVGLNHLTWIRAVRVDGVDRMAELLDDELAADVHVTAERLRSDAAIPSYYLQYYDDEAGVVAQARTHPTRAEEVMSIERDLLELYRDPALDTKPELLEHRGGAFYSEAAAQLIASLTDGRRDIQVVDVRNDGTLPGLADADIVEVPARIDRDGAHPIPQAPLSPAQFELVTRVKAYERLAIRAAVSGDTAIARAALAANPLAGDPARADELLDAILEVNARWLPRFFPNG